jgi:hypothetical protein
MRGVVLLLMLWGCDRAPLADEALTSPSGCTISSAAIPRLACSYDLTVDEDTFRDETQCFVVDDGSVVTVSVTTTEFPATVYTRFRGDALHSTDIFLRGAHLSASGSASLSQTQIWQVDMDLVTANGHRIRGTVWGDGSPVAAATANCAR